jgi:hypothetical protein
VFQPQPITPVIIKVVPAPTPEVSVVSIMVDALGLTGLIAIASLVVGLVFGVLLISYTRWRDQRSDGTDTGARLDLSSPGKPPADDTP